MARVCCKYRPKLHSFRCLPYCTMPGSMRDFRCAATCLLLLLSGVELRPHGWAESRRQLQTIQRRILDRLGLQQPPVPRQRLDPDGVRRAHQLYREQLSQLRGNRSREESRVPAPPRTLHLLTPKLERRPDASAGSCCYNLVLSRTEAFQQALSVTRAELRLFQQALSAHDVSRLNVSWPSRVTIYGLPEPGQRSGHPKLLHSYALDALTLSLDLGAAVRRWAASTEQRLHLQLVFAADISAFLATNRTSQGAETLNLEVETQEYLGSRPRKARALEEECKKSDGKCCLKSLKVSFHDIGWSDWVIAPNSYYMKFCEGSCPHNYKPASMHAQIKARMHTLSKETPAPCCVPAGYDPMVLMHYNSDGRLVSTLFEDMIVTKCHCA
ncbi:growth differentiation factor 15 [Chelydra serpentina]|uniref:Growth differentiation factor 15 n=1 Tax=Chelydra serpentina TaxID=8475 RepID=A0A8T1SFE7_CHESE|nr:growth differentiation factor 15 [Chelydra serpentina]